MEVCANLLWKTTGTIVGDKLNFDKGGFDLPSCRNLEIDFHLRGKRNIFIDL